MKTAFKGSRLTITLDSHNAFDEESALAALTQESSKFVNLICTHSSAA